MNNKIKISAAGNVEIPAYLTIIDKGYKVKCKKNTDKPENEIWYAEKNGNEFTAGSPIELLGVVSMFEVRGSDWKASDKQVEEFLEKYEN